MKYLLDTHTYIWAQFERKRLPSSVWNVIERSDSELNISVASLWEMTIKAAKGTLTLPGGNLTKTLQSVETLGIEILGIRTAHLLALERLPMHHRDPFDRLLIAQAIAEHMTLLTRDEDIARYDVRRMWA